MLLNIVSLFILVSNFLSGINCAISIKEQKSVGGSGAKCAFLDGVYTSVMRRIFNKGFHKELSSEIEVMLTTTVLPDRCRILVEETLPKGLYVDQDQLRDMYEFTGLKTLVNAKVNVESPEFEAEAFRLYIFRDLSIKENLRLTNVEVPVHLRYHLPKMQTDKETAMGVEPSAIVKIQNPRILLSCDDSDALDGGVARACPDRTVTSYCDMTGTSRCEYLVLPYKININAIEVSVPVGNARHTSFVVGLTTLIVSGATVYLMVGLFRATEMIGDAKELARKKMK